MRGDTAETRAVTLVDIPLVRRLSEYGTALDSELIFTQDGSSHAPNLFSLLLPYWGVYTLLTRAEDHQVVGQFRLESDSSYAHIAFVAPMPGEGESDTAWLHLLDTMAVEAGKRGAMILAAEVEENAPLFKTMRVAGYAIYARQEIWHRPVGEPDEPAQSITLSVPSESDVNGIHQLYGNIVPKLVLPVTELPEEGEGFVYRKDERVEGYIGVAEGKAGVYLMPHLHPDVFSEAASIIATAIQQVDRSGKVPVYVRVRRYQDWLDDALISLGFEICARQAVMVKHIAAGVRPAAFAPLRKKLHAIPNPVKPPTSGVAELPELDYNIRICKGVYAPITEDVTDGMSEVVKNCREMIARVPTKEF
jgi:hypothetical protein